MKHEWVASVLQDLHDYSIENELPETASLIMLTCEKMHIESDCICKGKKLSGSWCETECSATILQFPQK